MRFFTAQCNPTICKWYNSRYPSRLAKRESQPSFQRHGEPLKGVVFVCVQVMTRIRRWVFVPEIPVNEKNVCRSSTVEQRAYGKESSGRVFQCSLGKSLSLRCLSEGTIPCLNNGVSLSDHLSRHLFQVILDWSCEIGVVRLKDPFRVLVISGSRSKWLLK